MKNRTIYLLIPVLTFGLFSCEKHLTQQDPYVLAVEDAYKSNAGINSIAANLASRLRHEQNFSFGGSFYGAGINSNRHQDLARWDEAIYNHHTQWQHPGGNQNRNYRQYYDYDLIRDINIHIENLLNYGAVAESELRYYLAEARFYRAYTYYEMAFRMGGVPIIEEVYEYTSNPIEYAKPRNTEVEVYDYVISELEEIMDDLDIALSSGVTLTRPSKGVALALLCRVSLYAGTLAYNNDINEAKGLKLPSGAVGIPFAKAEDYLQKCIDAYYELEEMGIYSLYRGNGDLAENFYELFTKKSGNPELIFIKDYDGINFPNYFTETHIPRSQKLGADGAMLNPVLNLVECYEDVASKSNLFDVYIGDEQVENMSDNSSSFDYRIFETAGELFEGRDPRLTGSILYPGSTFRGIPVDLQAGLAVKTPAGYDFVHVDDINNVENPSNYYNGERKTGIDGPHRTSGFCSHTGFHMRKFLDPNPGSETGGQSTMPYVVFRYGEVLLNAAEAAWYLNQKDLALDLINRVRNRAGGEVFELEMAELDLDRIMNERRVELAFEDHRFNDAKRWRIADEIWDNDRNTPTAVTYAMWPYKIYAPGDPDDGKWLFRKLLVEHRGLSSDMGMPINFGLDMYYAYIPVNDGNPLIEKNPYH
ncbi:MAG: RagB/SusD family nutrient uptake outer membrane protein [Deltaproteobacteria bacterium]|nr:RagB/SusD family nutrient uptake outer membrane protein [Deltaproteobacteria bacterium]